MALPSLLTLPPAAVRAEAAGIARWNKDEKAEKLYIMVMATRRLALPCTNILILLGIS
jgi:hypothetical protein